MRFKIDIPNKIHYNTKMNIIMDFINYGNHLANDKILTICNEARNQFYKSINQTELNCFGYGNIITDAQTQYVNEGKYGDLINIDLTFDLHSDIAYHIYYHIYTTQKTIAKVKTGMLFYDYKSKRVKKIPEAFKNIFC